MNKAQILELLEMLDLEDEVYVAIPTNDYWRHVKVMPIRSAGFENVKESAYTESLLLVERDDWNDSDEDEEEETKEVFVIRTLDILNKL